MSLLLRFKQKILSAAGSTDVSAIDLSENEINLGYNTLILSELFYRANTSITDYLGNFELDPITALKLYNKNNVSERYFIVRLRVDNINLPHGFYDIPNEQNIRQGIIFTGSFGEIVNNGQL